MSALKSISSPRFWLPVAFFLASSSLTVLLWKVVNDAEHQRMVLETQITAEQVKLRLEAWFDTRGSVVTQFAEELVNHSDLEEWEFTRRAKRIIQLHPGFQALNYIDSDWVIRIVVPEETNRPALGKDLHNHPSAGVVEAIGGAQQAKSLRRTPLINLLQGGAGFATYAPLVQNDGTVRGFINGVFGVDELVDSCLSEERLRQSFNFRLRTPEAQLAYSHPSHWQVDGDRHVQSLPVRIVNQDWILDISLSDQGLGMVDSSADDLLASVGFGLSLVLSLLLWAYQQRQDELNKGREIYRLIVENQLDLLVRVSLEGNLVYVSPSFSRVVGRTETGLLGTPFKQLVFQEDHDRFERAFSRIQTSPHIVDEELRLLTPKGPIWTAWKGSGFRSKGGALEGFIGVGRDITPRLELEKQLRQSQRLQAVGQLAGGIAHDFNNILQAIHGYLEYVMEDLPSESEAYQDLDQARLASERAAELVRQLLAFSRRQILKRVNLDLNRSVNDMTDMLIRSIGRSIKIQHEHQKDLWPILADPGQVEQVLLNLAINARDAMPEGGKVTIATRNVILDDEFCRLHQGKEPGSYVQMEFMDTGMGMEPEVVDQIFEPFYTTKEPGKGTGLGMAMIYGIIKQHDGMITVQSQPGEGTTFSLFFPRSEANLEDSEPQAPAQISSGSETVLLVEDEPLLRNLGTKMLNSAGYKVLTGVDGVDGWQVYLAHREDIDLLLLDVVMPNMSGIELATQIRDTSPDIPIVFISGYDYSEAAGKSEHLSGSVRLSKPYNSQDLLGAIRQVLGKNCL